MTVPSPSKDVYGPTNDEPKVALTTSGPHPLLSTTLPETTSHVDNDSVFMKNLRTKHGGGCSLVSVWDFKRKHRSGQQHNRTIKSGGPGLGFPSKPINKNRSSPGSEG